nr:low-density lipoprotein receptor-related protein 1B-like [Cherax quadricarinatus]
MVFAIHRRVNTVGIELVHGSIRPTTVHELLLLIIRNIYGIDDMELYGVALNGSFKIFVKLLQVQVYEGLVDRYQDLSMEVTPEVSVRLVDVFHQYMWVREICSEIQFKCKSSGECIPRLWVCDETKDCRDSSDEENCGFTHSLSTSSPALSTSINVEEICSEIQFKCKSSGECIPRLWVCDETKDCRDSSDEENCGFTQSLSTSSPSLSTSINIEKEDPCERKECSHHCLSSRLLPSGFICYCPSGMRLQDDRRTCVAKEPDQVMEFPWKTG